MSDRPRFDRDPHGWFIARLEAAASGLLSDVEQQRFDRHVSDCSECRQRWELYVQHLPTTEPEPHLPVALVACWGDASSQLRGIERRLVREHLETCEECRRDLQFAGFNPEFPVDPGLERVDTSEETESEAPVARRRYIRTGAGSRARDLGIGGAIGALAATMLVVAVFSQRPESVAVPPLPPTTVVSPGTEWRLEPLAPEIRLRGLSRSGDGSEPVTAQIDSSTRAIHLGLPEFYASVGTPVHVTVVAPDGTPVVSRGFQFEELAASGRTLLITTEPKPLPGGTYEVIVAVGPDAKRPNDPIVTYTTSLVLVAKGTR